MHLSARQLAGDKAGDKAVLKYVGICEQELEEQRWWGTCFDRIALNRCANLSSALLRTAVASRVSATRRPVFGLPCDDSHHALARNAQ